MMAAASEQFGTWLGLFTGLSVTAALLLRRFARNLPVRAGLPAG
ncbi:hypothetical protein [Actinomadura sp. 6N118]